MKYKVGQIVNFKNYGNIFMKAIALRNKLKYGERGYTHTGIIVEVGEQIIIYEALNEGFEPFVYDKWWLDQKLEAGIIAIGETKHKLRNVPKYAEFYKGRPYGWLDIFSIVVGALTGFKLSITGNKKLICSEAVARILYDSSNKKIDFVKEFGKSYDLIEPHDLFMSKQLKW